MSECTKKSVILLVKWACIYWACSLLFTFSDVIIAIVIKQKVVKTNMDVSYIYHIIHVLFFPSSLNQCSTDHSTDTASSLIILYDTYVIPVSDIRVPGNLGLPHS